MGKIYKGWELMKAIADGEIKNGAKIIPHYPNNDCIVKYFEYFCGFFKAYYKEGKRSDEDVNVCVFLDNDRTFELIEDEIDIDSIEEIKLRPSDREHLSFGGLIFEEKINKLVQAVKQLNKEVKELKKI